MPRTIAKKKKPDETLLDVIEDKAFLYHRKVPEILAKMIINAREKGEPSEAIRLAMALKECAQLAVDFAAKAAPYKHHKLESVDVKTEIEQKFVIRAPTQLKSIDEWMQMTGAKVLDVNKGD
jgi:hypothetical protein